MTARLLMPWLLFALLAGPARAQDASAQNIRVWASSFAGRSSIAGNPKEDTQSVVASIVGVTIGADTQLKDGSLLGLSLGRSRQTFAAGTGTGFGKSDDVTITAYARQPLWGAAYIAEALGFGWHKVSTHRTVTVLMTHVLEAEFDAHDVGGRLEGGYNFVLPGRGVLSPFAAIVGDSYAQPAYGEYATRGHNTYAVNYAANTIGTSHVELGTRYYDAFALNPGVLNLDVALAWQHDLNNNPLVVAQFQTLPGTNFVLRGTSPSIETLLFGLGTRLLIGDRITFGLRGDTRLGARTTIISGSLDFTYRW
jgi:uncharacterized protein with beta-barrel porin domain